MATRLDPFVDPARWMEQLLGVPRETSTTAVPAMPMDLYRAGDHYVMHVDLPGADPGSIDVNVEDRTLTIRAERTGRAGVQEGEVQWLARERAHGTYVRQLTVGRGLALDRIEPAGFRRRLLEDAVARAQGAFERVRARRVTGVYGEHEPVEKAPAVAGRPAEQTIEIRRQPDQPQMLGESRGASGDAVDPGDAGAPALGIRLAQPGAETGPVIGEGDGSRKAARPALAGHGRKIGAPQPPTRGKQRERLEDIGLAGAVLAAQRDNAARDGQLERGVGAEIPKRQMRDGAQGRGRAQTRIGIRT